jgi:hypothetical protein
VQSSAGLPALEHERTQKEPWPNQVQDEWFLLR